MAGFNLCIICEAPKGTCKHTSASVAKQHAMKKQIEKGLAFGSMYGTHSGSLKAALGLEQSLQKPQPWEWRVFWTLDRRLIVTKMQPTVVQTTGQLDPQLTVSFDEGDLLCYQNPLLHIWDTVHNRFGGGAMQEIGPLLMGCWPYPTNGIFMKRKTTSVPNSTESSYAQQLAAYKQLHEQYVESSLGKQWVQQHVLGTFPDAKNDPEFKAQQINAEKWGKAASQLSANDIQKLYNAATSDLIIPEPVPPQAEVTLQKTDAQSRVELTISGLTPEEADALMRKYKSGQKLMSTRPMKEIGTGSKGFLFWEFESSSMMLNGTPIKYVTQLNEDGTLSCNCRGWTQGSAKSPDGRHCKHTEAIGAKYDVADLFKKWKKGLPLGDEFQPMEQVEEKTKKLSTTAAPMMAKRVIEL